MDDEAGIGKRTSRFNRIDIFFEFYLIDELTGRKFQNDG